MNSILRSLAGGLILFLLMALSARAEETYELDIADQELSSALKLFAEQSGLQVVYFADLAAGKQAKGVHGTYSADQALSELLDDTDLIYSTVDERTYSINAAAAVEDAGGDRDPGNRTAAGATPRPVMMAQASAEQSQMSRRTETDIGNDGQKPPLEEIVVTGTNIRGAAPVGFATLTLDRSDIDQSGFFNTTQLFVSLPQNFSGFSLETFNATGSSSLAVANVERASAIDLRGLGPDATLTLVNGARRAGALAGRVVDVSLIPMSAIERVEIVTGGNSAIYGSDAVGGVANVVTRLHFDGAETRGSVGLRNDGGQRAQASQTIGIDGSKGGFIIAYDFTKEWALNLADTESLNSPDSIGREYSQFNIIPDSRSHSALAAGHIEISSGVELFGLGTYTNRHLELKSLLQWPGAANESFTASVNKSENYGVSGGIRSRLFGDWEFEAKGSFNRSEFSGESAAHTELSSFSFDIARDDQDSSSLTMVSLIANGSLFSIGSIKPRAAVGIEYRRDKIDSLTNQIFSGDFNSTSFSEVSGERDVKSAFVEIILPLVEDGRPGLYAADISAAVRYDDYSDVGGTTNPQIGLRYYPLEKFSLRGSYSSAFRAPALFELIPDSRFFLEEIDDPVFGGPRPVLVHRGGNLRLRPETADTWTWGFDYQPLNSETLVISASFYDINYKGRVDSPATTGTDRRTAFLNPDAFSDFINRNPTSADVNAVVQDPNSTLGTSDPTLPWDPITQDLLTLHPDLAIFDTRTANISREHVQGLDFKIDARAPLNGSELDFGINVNHVLEHNRRLVAGSTPFTMFDQVGRPASTRLRGKVGWRNFTYGAWLHVNYIDDYKNQFSSPAEKVSSWTTADFTFTFDGAELGDNSALRGLKASLGIQNIFDQAPPKVVTPANFRSYDPANASPIGRYFTFSVTQHW